MGSIRERPLLPNALRTFITWAFMILVVTVAAHGLAAITHSEVAVTPIAPQTERALSLAATPSTGTIAVASAEPVMPVRTLAKLVSTPDSHRGAAMLEVQAQPQERKLNCEFQSAADLAGYYGWNVTWEELFETVGPDPSGIPHVGFAGRSIDDPPGGIYPSGYGVYAEPIARGLRRLGIAATAHSGKDPSWLRSQIEGDRPTIVWTTYDMQPQPIIEWTSSEGERVQGVRFEHTYTVVGYDDGGVWVLDPYNAIRQFFPWRVFETSWSLLGYMALTIDETPPQ